jgi:hypothetical protein
MNGPESGGGKVVWLQKRTRRWDKQKKKKRKENVHFY